MGSKGGMLDGGRVERRKNGSVEGCPTGTECTCGLANSVADP
jgi:hypothetical protein